MSVFDSDEFKAIERAWYNKLATTPDDTGELFEDIEDTLRVERPLKTWSRTDFNHADLDKIKANQAYYEACTNLLHTYKFINATQKRIWELHSEGRSRRKISKEIKDMVPNYSQSRVGYIIKKISQAVTGETRASNRS